MIEAAFKKYKSKEIYLSFNGGKDCTVLLHLVWAIVKKLEINEPINCIYIKTGIVFPEVDEFIFCMKKRYNLKVVEIFGPIKVALTELYKTNLDIKAIFMGTRRTDPYSESLEEFQVGLLR